MAEHLERPGEDRTGIDWRQVRRRLVLILALLLMAITLVVGTQNFDEQASMHFLLWSFDAPLLVFFLSSICLGVIADEFVRLWVHVRRRRSPSLPERPAPIAGR